MANGYPHGTVADMGSPTYPSTNAKVEFWQGTLKLTVYLTKAAGVATWSYNTSITAGNYTVIATDISAGRTQTYSPNPVTVPAAPITISFFNLQSLEGAVAAIPPAHQAALDFHAQALALENLHFQTPGLQPKRVRVTATALEIDEG